VLEEKRVADLYVCGLDLSTGRVVQADEREVWEWYDKGHNELFRATAGDCR